MMKSNLHGMVFKDADGSIAFLASNVSKRAQRKSPAGAETIKRKGVAYK
ncbi:MAG: hypothetical protein MSS66_07270 [Selenomonadaceae bacterium]|nr:hypothetical protein [Selenomonadaceae bacterium]